jgi:peptidoglycan glycosyltransferase
MDRQIRKLALAMAGLFVILFAQLNYIQVYAADDIANNPANFRLIIQEYKVDRGEILARDLHTVLAKSVPTKGSLEFLRVYPNGPLYADVTGYYSLIYQRSRLEASENDYLAARATELLPSNIEDDILNRPKRGASVVTTIDPNLQRVASEALAGRAGAVAALDPRTGEVLALVSNPTFDPNELSSHDPKAIKAAWDKLIKDPSKPLLSNATDQIYPPGSTFKLIDTAAALENGYTPQSRFPNPRELTLPQTTHKFHNFGGSLCPGGSSITLALALTISCDITFAELGLKLGGDVLYNEARKFGFDQQIPFDLSFAEGRFPTPDFFPSRLPLLAFSAIGQADVAANPLQMALVAAAIANQGREMQPQLVKEIRGPDGGVLRSLQPKVWGQPISEQTAATMTQMMVSVVQSGTGTPAQIPGVNVAAKTGTSQTPSGNPHAWFVAFAPAENPKIALAVVLLNGGGSGSEATGGTVAGPVAKTIIEAALGIGG